MSPDRDLLEADAKARVDALDVRRSFIVQAPAGSGKTELLIQRYLCLLATVDEPEEVLAITFTRKASLEMQQRVLRALQQARDGADATHDHEKRTLGLAERVLDRDRRSGWDLINSPRRMRIMTLDALCASIARMLPLSSGLGGTPRTISDADAKAAYRSAAIATLDWLAADGAERQSLEQVLDHLDNDTGIFVTYMGRMLQSRDQWLQIVGSGRLRASQAVRDELESNLAMLVWRHLQRLRQRMARHAADDLVRLAAHAGSRLAEAGDRSSPIESLAGLHALPADTPDSVDLWRGMAELLLTRAGSWRSRLTKNEGFPPADAALKAECGDLIAALAVDDELARALHAVRSLPPIAYDDRQWDVLMALLRVLPVAVGELKRLFAERGVTDHIEIALAAEAALGTAEHPGDVALMLDYRVRHLLVDEMQDTSIGQYRLLETLTAGWEPGDGRTLFCVGDPMQSIYRFRNAEVGRFVMARTDGVAALPLEALTLRRNFRSGEHLVHWFNTVFGQVFPSMDDVASGAVAYADSVPVDALRGQGTCRVHPLFGAGAADEALRAAEIVGECLDSPPHEDVAVLVRSRTQLPLLLAELRRRGVAYRAVEIDRLTDLPEIIELLALTRAYCHPGDRAAWLGLLRCPLVGLDWTDLHALVEGERDACVEDLMRDDERLVRLSAEGRRRVRALAETLGPLFAPNLALGLRERIERAWFALGGPGLPGTAEHTTNAYAYLRVLDKIEVAGSLADPAAIEQALDDERVSSPPSDTCRVQVMTMHKAKGLQFDHVVLPSLGRTTSAGERPVLNWLDLPGQGGASHLVLSPVGARADLEQDALHRYIETTHRDSDRLELDRLLYVACTRARKSLHLLGHVATAPDGEEFRPPPAGTPLSRLWPALAAEFQAAFGRRPGPGPRAGEEDGRGPYGQPRLRRIATDWRLPAPPPLAGRDAPSPAAAAAPDVPVEFHWVGAVARHAGTIVHRWLHRLANAAVLPGELEGTSTDAISARWARQLGVPEPDLSTVCGRVRLALGQVLADPRGRWLLEGDGHAELALTGVWQSRRTSVVIDRVRVDADGAHWVVDYKTGTHEGGDLAGFLEQESLRYAAQLSRYAAIYGAYSGATVRCALYFPLLQQFVEVAV